MNAVTADFDHAFIPVKKRYLLIGCGQDRGKRMKPEASHCEDFSDGDLVTLDYDFSTQPNVIHDLEKLPYPFPNEEFDEIHAYEVLEHCGAQGDAKFFFGQFAEFYRILKPGGYMCISVPMWDSEVQWAVPDHKRAMPPALFGFLNQDYYKNVGKPGFGDYRNLLGRTDFVPCGKQDHPQSQSVFILLQARK